MNAPDVLLIENACRHLVLQAAAHADANEPARLAELFTEHGVLTRPNSAPLKGRIEILRAYQQRPADRLTCHLVTSTLVPVQSPSEARARSYVLLWAGQSRQPPGPFGVVAQPRQVVGEFDDRFVQTEQGWKIAERTAKFLLYCGE